MIVNLHRVTPRTCQANGCDKFADWQALVNDRKGMFPLHMDYWCEEHLPPEARESLDFLIQTAMTPL